MSIFSNVNMTKNIAGVVTISTWTRGIISVCSCTWVMSKTVTCLILRTKVLSGLVNVGNILICLSYGERLVGRHEWLLANWGDCQHCNLLAFLWKAAFYALYFSNSLRLSTYECFECLGLAIFVEYVWGCLCLPWIKVDAVNIRYSTNYISCLGWHWRGFAHVTAIKTTNPSNDLATVFVRLLLTISSLLQVIGIDGRLLGYAVQLAKELALGRFKIVCMVRRLRSTEKLIHFLVHHSECLRIRFGTTVFIKIF